jgi:hypothetical protein
MNQEHNDLVTGRKTLARTTRSEVGKEERVMKQRNLTPNDAINHQLTGRPMENRKVDPIIQCHMN